MSPFKIPLNPQTARTPDCTRRPTIYTRLMRSVNLSAGTKQA